MKQKPNKQTSKYTKVETQKSGNKPECTNENNNNKKQKMAIAFK